MAKYCAFCGKKMGAFTVALPIPDSNYEYCDGHWEYIRQLRDLLTENVEANTDGIVTDFRNSLQTVSENFDTAISIVINKVRDERKEVLKAQEELEQRKKQDKERQQTIEESVCEIILTTGSLFDGYTVEQYIDVICEEVVFKNSFINQLGAEIEDLGNVFSFKEKELTGSSELIKKAREYVMKKFRRSAAELGANAILGVDFENSFGDKVVRVSVSGTAVVISKKE